MNVFGHRCVPQRLILVVVAVGALMFCSITTATEAMPREALSVPENSRPGPLGLGVSGASAGITTDYFEQTVSDALLASGIFSGIDNSTTAGVVMPMIRAKGVFPGSANSSDAPYFLDIRIIKVDAPSFSVRMTVGMKAIWALYRVADKTELLREIIESTYTGGMFEGGVHGANRVRVAMEGATRENIRIGMELIESLDFRKESPVREQNEVLEQE